MKSMERDEEKKAFQEALELRRAGLVKGADGTLTNAPRSARERGDILFQAKQKGLTPSFDDEGNIIGTTYDPEYVAMQRDKSTVDPFGLKRLQAQKMKDELERKGSPAKSPIAGYQTNENYLGDKKEDRDIRTAQAQTKKFSDILETLKARVRNAQKSELVNPYSNTAKDIKNDLRDLQFLYKSPEFANLGVLTGPDLKLLEEVIENPGSLSNVISGKEGVLSRYDQLQKKVKDGFNTAPALPTVLPTISSGRPKIIFDSSLAIAREAIDAASDAPQYR